MQIGDQHCFSRFIVLFFGFVFKATYVLSLNLFLQWCGFFRQIYVQKAKGSGYHIQYVTCHVVRFGLWKQHPHRSIICLLLTHWNAAFVELFLSLSGPSSHLFNWSTFFFILMDWWINWIKKFATTTIRNLDVLQLQFKQNYRNRKFRKACWFPQISCSFFHTAVFQRPFERRQWNPESAIKKWPWPMLRLWRRRWRWVMKIAITHQWHLQTTRHSAGVFTNKFFRASCVQQGKFCVHWCSPKKNCVHLPKFLCSPKKMCQEEICFCPLGKVYLGGHFFGFFCYSLDFFSDNWQGGFIFGWLFVKGFGRSVRDLCLFWDG